MANIKQAAKWIQKGKQVRRKALPWWVLKDNGGRISTLDDRLTNAFSLIDLLANDWEIADDAHA